MAAKLYARVSPLVISAALAFAIATTSLFLGGWPRTGAASPTPLTFSIDCDLAAAGIQSACTRTSGTTTVDVAVVLTNNSGGAFELDAFNFKMETDQTVLSPVDAADGNLDANPDFNEEDVTGAWQCKPPDPREDEDPSPTVARSILSCFNATFDGPNATFDGPTVADGASMVLAFVRYAAADGGARTSLSQTGAYDQDFNDLGSCGPVNVVESDCLDATIMIGAAGAPATAAASAAVAEGTPTASIPPTPTPGTSVLATDSSVRAALVADSDGSGGRTGADAPAETLVQLELTGQGAIDVYTDADGAFSFEAVPPGEYVVAVWWSPGFISLSAVDTHPGLYETTVSVAKDGTVRGELPAEILVKPKPPGLIPYPVRTGGGGQQPIPVGRVNVASVLAAGAGAAAPVSGLPGTGSGPSRSPWLPVLLLALALAVLPGASVLLAHRRRRS